MKKIKILLFLCLLIIVGLNVISPNVFAMNSKQCKQCHQGVKKSWEKSGHAKIGISCLSCHKTSMKLRRDKKDLCGTCHSTGEIKVGGSIGMPQKEVFEGRPNFWLKKEVVIPHNANDVNCIDCHMPGDSKNHTFEIVMPYQEANTEKNEGANGDDKEQNKACVTGCHTIVEPRLLQSRIDRPQLYVERLLKETKKLLEDKKEFKDKDGYQKAQMAYKLVIKDGSKGIHNNAYVNRLLKKSIEELKKFKTEETK